MCINYKLKKSTKLIIFVSEIKKCKQLKKTKKETITITATNGSHIYIMEFKIVFEVVLFQPVTFSSVFDLVE